MKVSLSESKALDNMCEGDLKLTCQRRANNTNVACSQCCAATNTYTHIPVAVWPLRTSSQKQMWSVAVPRLLQYATSHLSAGTPVSIATKQRVHRVEISWDCMPFYSLSGGHSSTFSWAASPGQQECQALTQNRGRSVATLVATQDHAASWRAGWEWAVRYVWVQPCGTLGLPVFIRVRSAKPFKVSTVKRLESLVSRPASFRSATFGVGSYATLRLRF